MFNLSFRNSGMFAQIKDIILKLTWTSFSRQTHFYQDIEHFECVWRLTVIGPQNLPLIIIKSYLSNLVEFIFDLRLFVKFKIRLLHIEVYVQILHSARYAYKLYLHLVSRLKLFFSICSLLVQNINVREACEMY